MKICPKCLQRYDEQTYCDDDGTRLRPIHSEGEDALIGRVLDDRWIVEEKIGEGGMGAVYKGHQTSVGRKVAIKTLRGSLTDTREYVERFFREANVASTLNHPHCVTIYDFGQDPEDKALYLAMEFLEGQSLAGRLGRGRMPLGEALTVVCQICSALAAAHRANIVHRDLKPDNVFLVDVPGDEIFVKVLDFGIAKITDDADASTVTRTGQIFGTPAYMSPEQCHSADVDARSDLYSLGVMLYELVAGRPPFGGNTPLKTLLAHVSSEVDPLGERGIDVPGGVEQIIMRLLEKDPADRFQDALQVRGAIEAQLAELPAEVLERASSHEPAMVVGGADTRVETVVFEDLAADGGAELEKLEEANRKITAELEQRRRTQRLADADPVARRAPPREVVTDQTERVEDGEEEGDEVDRRGGRLALVALVGLLVGGAAVFFAVDSQKSDSPPSPVQAQAPQTETVEPVDPPEHGVSLSESSEAAQQLVLAAVAKGAEVQKEHAEAKEVKPTKKPRAKKTTKKQRRPAKPRVAPKKKEEVQKDDPMLPLLTETAARRVIASHNGAITTCFEKGLLRDPDFAGEVTVRMVIASDGTVANADIRRSTVQDADIKSCILNEVRSWSFPETLDGRVKVLTTPFAYQAPRVD